MSLCTTLESPTLEMDAGMKISQPFRVRARDARKTSGSSSSPWVVSSRTTHSAMFLRSHALQQVAAKPSKLTPPRAGRQRSPLISSGPVHVQQDGLAGPGKLVRDDLVIIFGKSYYLGTYQR